jgi:hypothetical protein
MKTTAVGSSGDFVKLHGCSDSIVRHILRMGRAGNLESIAGGAGSAIDQLPDERRLERTGRIARRWAEGRRSCWEGGREGNERRSSEEESSGRWEMHIDLLITVDEGRRRNEKK